MSKIVAGLVERGIKTITVAGTAYPLSPTPVKVQNVIISAPRTNGGDIIVGGAGVSLSSGGMLIPPGNSGSISADSIEGDGTLATIDLGAIFVTSNNAGDLVYVSSVDVLTEEY
jgi:hypothetical protein